MSVKIENQINHKLDFGELSPDRRLNALLTSVVSDVKIYAEDQIRRINQLVQIGIALSAEKDTSKILEMIVDEARSLCGADAGTLYIIDNDHKRLRFKIVQNDSLNIRIGGVSGSKMTFPDIPLYKEDNQPNHSNVATYVALTGETITIPDVYEADGFDFTGPRNFDQATGYRSKSMFVIALKNHENDIIGVLQLLNALEGNTNKVIPFSDKLMVIVASLASQAAVTLTNNALVYDLNELFYSFIKSIAVFVDKKSIYTGEHIRRVVDLTMLIASYINADDEWSFKDVHFDEDHLDELKMAAWMHDIGKVTTPEYVLDKSSRLETISDRIEMIETRYQLIAQLLENNFLHHQNELLCNGQGQDINVENEHLKAELKRETALLQDEFSFIKDCNYNRGRMKPDDIRRLEKIAKKTYFIHNEPNPYLTPDELKNLSIPAGNLTMEERNVIENHVTMTRNILAQLPFPKNLSHVAEYASSHHERLDGSGYPNGLSGEEVPLQSRILAIADVFEALTAKNRPYRDPMKLSKALQVLNVLKEKGQIDSDIIDMFTNKKIFREYAEKELKPEQIDILLDNDE
ncbi:HD domain-containing phosphohydrolase [Desulfococcaceae bacterium HSG9]|nr:HD domain-containing phosphohydrolase [Desulfococcaceae bacterium HSG9]